MSYIDGKKCVAKYSLPLKCMPFGLFRERIQLELDTRKVDGKSISTPSAMIIIMLKLSQKCVCIYTHIFTNSIQEL